MSFLSRGALSGLLAALMLTLLSACASTDTENRQRYATLVTNVQPPALRSHAIEISRIDDRRFNLGEFDPNLLRFTNGRATHRVSPGEHVIEGVPIIRDAFSSPRITGLNRSPLPLTANFESGRRYYLAIERSKTERRRWQVVIWKVEDTESGLLDLD